MWQRGWREAAWSRLAEPWDILIVGGGITGAGILREATRLGLRALLVERRDFAWGTSSRSSKLVHGGLRYLQEGRVRLTRACVQERERLLGEGPGLIDPLGFLLATYKGDRPGRWTYKVGLSIYDLLALQWSHRHYSAQDFEMLAPHIAQDGLKGGFRFGDAQTDDARLVLRVIREAVAEGGLALSYVAAEELLRREGLVAGIRLRDTLEDRTQEVWARAVVNATGAWADGLRGQLGAPPRIRPLRGSHLIFPAWRLPVAQAVSFLHPVDRRPVFVFPWEGITLVGTTDLDHDQPLNEEPAIGPQEVSYLMAAAEAQFPALDLGLGDVLATFSGVRPVIGTGQGDPSKESRDHVIWEENGLFTVTGGKLTTFRLIALDVLKSIRSRLPEMPEPKHDMPVLNQVDQLLPGCDDLRDACRMRLLGRYGADALTLVNSAQPGEMEAIPGTDYLWAELRWAARAEGVCHLDDLLLRRTRLGLILPQGADSILPMVKQICVAELSWSEDQWQHEQSEYLSLWKCCYSLPDHDSIPDWKAQLNTLKNRPTAHTSIYRKKVLHRSGVLAGLVLLSAVIFTTRWLKNRRDTTR